MGELGLLVQISNPVSPSIEFISQPTVPLGSEPAAEPCIKQMEIGLNTRDLAATLVFLDTSHVILCQKLTDTRRGIVDSREYRIACM